MGVLKFGSNLVGKFGKGEEGIVLRISLCLIFRLSPGLALAYLSPGVTRPPQ